MRWAFSPTVVAVGVAASVTLGSSAALAREASGEATCGRIDGDLAAAAGLGASFGPRGPSAQADVRLRYLASVGVFATYEDGALVGSSAEPARVLTTGFELRPLFLYRWLGGHETKGGWIDMAVDSIGLELGAAFLQPRASAFASQSGVEAGLGVEAPLLAAATGPWIGVHGGVRWGEGALASGVVHNADDRAGFVAITLSWHQVFAGHLVDFGDRSPR